MLLHVCCGPCATATVEYWRGEGFEPTGFFCNPNIHPFQEWQRRLEAARTFAESASLPLIADLSYDPAEWFRIAGLAGEERCAKCIGLRLDRAAEEAVQRGIPRFSTTLSISPWQDHGAIRETGERAARRHGATFEYVDLRDHYRRSQELSRALGLYRQKYCGCLLSEWERYRGS